MSRKGNCFDNAVIENFFGHLKEKSSTMSDTSLAELFRKRVALTVAWLEEVGKVDWGHEWGG